MRIVEPSRTVSADRIDVCYSAKQRFAAKHESAIDRYLEAA